MPVVIVWVVVFAASLYILIQSSDYFTRAAGQIGLAFGLPDFLVGLTIIAIGTSLPEIVSSLFAVLSGSSQIVVGNVVGSNVTNVFLVIGVAALIGKKIEITYELIHIDLPLLMGSALFLAVTVWDGSFTLFEAILCLAGVVVYMLHAVFTKEKRSAATRRRLQRKRINWQTVATLVASALFIYVGGKYTIDAVIALSEVLRIGTEVIAASVIALGTSLPELAVTIAAARQGRPEIAVGNVIGSNIFNALAVMGIPALLGNLVIPNNIITFGIPMMLIASLLFFFMGQDKEITQWEGWLLIIFYVFFIGKLFAVV
ncbi:conjugal transfer protein TraR [candidate division WOR_3 bacterium SM23_60]|uniref:Conjugal transfer protein TraR n=1 Tax=candidate division WOR_3 bacterium SM23_60 TaxID=1703780 RepID=A0A0S8GK19_UNCW3|nr:MAG: conjugal transfer protein TraR [candidate division WOR_3 bacterium SM23_60]